MGSLRVLAVINKHYIEDSQIQPLNKPLRYIKNKICCIRILILRTLGTATEAGSVENLPQGGVTLYPCLISILF